MTLGDICAYPKTLAAGSAALTRITNLDRAFPLPPLVHHGLAGLVSKSYCNGWAMPGMDADTAMAVAAGVAGGTLAVMLF